MKTKDEFRKMLASSEALSSKPDEKGYLKDYLDGVFPGGREHLKEGGKFYRMFAKGNGNELLPNKVARNTRPPKAYAVHSSSMLAYNFFHWISPECPFRFSDGRTYDKVYFEVRMKTLKTSNMPVNMDVMLVSDDCRSILCFESKFTEVNQTGDASFRPAYLDKANYYNNYFRDDFIGYISQFENVPHMYNDGIKQVVRHLLAISNLEQSNFAMNDFLTMNDFIEPEVAQMMQQRPLNISFANLLFFNNQPAISSKCAINYASMLDRFRASDCFSTYFKNLMLQPLFVNTYDNILSIMQHQMPDGLYDYLTTRYPTLHHVAEDGDRMYTC